MSNKYDVIIVGAGPGGFSAGIYTSRAGLSTLILEKNIPGGQVLTTEKVENYPGFIEAVSGYDLIEKMRVQTVNFGAEIKSGINVEGIEKIAEDDVLVKTKDQEYHALSVIIASGAAPRLIGVPGEKKFTGRGVSYCAVCDGRFFTNKEVVVLGGGDTAVEEAIFLSKFCSKVTLIHRRDRLRATQVLQERLKDNEKIELILDAAVQEITGEDKVSGVTYIDNVSKEARHLTCEGVFVFVGYIPNSTYVKDFVESDEAGYLVTDQEMRTNKEGIFACGDVRSKRLRQVVVSCGEGAVAAYSAQLYVDELLGRTYPTRESV